MSSKTSPKVYLQITLRYEDRLFTFEQGMKLMEILGQSVRMEDDYASRLPPSYNVIVHNEHTLIQKQIDELLGIPLEDTPAHQMQN